MDRWMASQDVQAIRLQAQKLAWSEGLMYRPMHMLPAMKCGQNTAWYSSL